MRKVVFVICMLSWATLSAGESANKPIIKVDQADHDFGMIWSGPKLQHSFKITNVGNAELQITKVKPNCGLSNKCSNPSQGKSKGTFYFVGLTG